MRHKPKTSPQADLFGEAPTPPALHTWVPTREAGLARLHDFAPFAGRAYSANRNQDRGPEDRSNVSALSPWLRRRLITEEEVIAKVLRHHSPSAAEKFIQEVCWRSYWKGWLEMRPSLLTQFDGQRRALRTQFKSYGGLAKRLAQAEAGATGIECFDYWVEELVSTGWLHNHARMWFASIWIFTLNLPWQLGADFFYKHLLDADPASNTLSWRWVAGLHTRGKHYLARADNIARNTDGRFNPKGQLNETAGPLEDNDPPPTLLPLARSSPLPLGAFALLLHDDDLEVASWLPQYRVTSVAAFDSHQACLPNSVTARFRNGALADGVATASAVYGCDSAGVLDEIAVLAWAQNHSVIVAPQAPVGLTGWALDRLETKLAAQGSQLIRVRRSWDNAAWPHATAGFFKLKEKIPRLIAHLG